MAVAQSLEHLEQDLNKKILSGDALDAFEEYYADDIVMQEGSDEPFVGKRTNREREKEFFSKVTELRALELEEVAVGDDVTMSLWHYDFTHEDWGDQDFDQVAIRHWRDGEVVRERFVKTS